jgi:alkylresorcinol/alkylpyrone synthase
VPRLVALATAAPEHAVPQARIRELVERLFEGGPAGYSGCSRCSITRGSRRRSVCMPLEWYTEPRTFAEQNALYVEHALRLGASAAAARWPRPGCRRRRWITSSSSRPRGWPRRASTRGCRWRSAAARLPPHARSGAWAARAAPPASRARATSRWPDPAAVVLLVAVELCSLTFRHADRDKRNLVATSLFSDGAGRRGHRRSGGPRRRGDPGARLARALELVAPAARCGRTHST